LNRSILSFDAKKYKEALTDCNAAISKMPKNYNSYILRGQIKIFLSDSIGAKHDFEFTIAHDSQNVIAYYYLAGYFHDKDVYDSALYNYSKVVELNPYNAECYYNRASLEAQHDHFAEALSDYSKVIALNPKNLFAFFYRGNVKHRLKDHKGAIEDYSTVISLYPTFYHAYFLRASEYEEIKNYRASETDKKIAGMLMTNNDSIKYSVEEIASFKKLFEFRSDFDNTDTTQGKIQFTPREIVLKPQFNICLVKPNAVSEYPKYNAEMVRLNSIKDPGYNVVFSTKNMNLGFDEVVTLQTMIDSMAGADSVSDIFHLWRSLFSCALVNYNKAITSAEQIADTSKYSYLAWLIKGNLHFALGQQEENEQMNNQLFLYDNTPVNSNYYLQALQDYSVSVSKNDRFSLGYYNRAYVKGVLQDFTGAILDYSVSIFYDNTFAEAYYNRGVLYLYMGNKEQGCKDISKAGELGIKESYNVLYKYCSQ
jgi:tetratricopeptide (TPR) repeat protein